jgi:hypothetical protein
MIPKSKQVFSPHIYGPFVTQDYPSYFHDPSFPQNMRAVWDRHFGYLLSQGFTIVPGEWGSWYATFGYKTDPIAQKDKVWMNSLISYFNQKHLCSSFYWDLGTYSQSTGGVLDWSYINEVPEKAQALRTYFQDCSPIGSGNYNYSAPSSTVDPTAKSNPTSVLLPTAIPTQSNISYCISGRSCTCDGLEGRDNPGHCGQCGGAWCDGGFCHCAAPASKNTRRVKPTSVPSSCVPGKVCNCDGLDGRDGPGHCGQCGGAWCDGGFCHC